MFKYTLPRSCARASKFIAGIALGSIAFASLSPLASAAGSWAPTLLVNTESFQQIDGGDGSTDIELRFGSSGVTLKYLTNGKFQFSAGLSVLGTLSGSNLNIDRNATIGGALTATGAITTKSTLSGANLVINRNGNFGGQLTVTGAILGASTITAKTVLSGTTLRVSGNADVQGALAASGAIRTDGNLTINDDADSNNAVLTFGNTSGNQSITFLNTAQRFQFSRGISVLGTISGSSLNVDRNATVGGTLTVTGAVLGMSTITAKTVLSGTTLRVSGNADINGSLSVTGSILTEGNLTLGGDDAATDVSLTFMNSGTDETFTWLESNDKFYLSDDLDVNGTISGTTLKISGNGTHTMSGSLTIEGALSGSTIQGFGLGDCSGTNQKLVYNAAIDKFECATDQTGAGSNGSGQILSLHPEYPGAVYYASGSVFVGQMTLSGGTTALDNTFKWTSTKAALNDYWISVRVRLPDNFSTWDPTKPIELRYKTGVASNANNYVSIRIKDTAGVERPLTGGENLASTSFTTASIKGPEAGGTWTPKGYVTIYVKLAANNTASAYAAAGFINLNFESTLP